MFGDQTATNTHKQCNVFAAKHRNPLDLEAAKAILEDSHYNDALTGGDKLTVQKMMGSVTITKKRGSIIHRNHIQNTCTSRF